MLIHQSSKILNILVENHLIFNHERFLGIAVLIVSLNFISEQAMAQEEDPTRVLLADSTQLLAYPLNVMSIVDKKCLGCHSPGSRSEKAREAFVWIGLQDMDKADLVGVMDEMLEVLEEGEMPPAKVVEKFPHLKLTEEETSTLKAWVDATINLAMNE